MTILLVEDALDLWETIRDYLIACGFKLERTTTVSQTKALLLKKTFDCIVLDRMLPDGSGEDLCKYIKKEYQTPVIMSTAKSQIDDKIEWFNAGADDYLTKPYDLRELEARINALTKRIDNMLTTIQLWWLSINQDAMTIKFNNKEIHCSNSERIILKVLLEQAGKVISRSDLIDYVRGGEGTRAYENKLDVLISGLRKKLGKKFIETVKWVGYKIKQD